MIKNLKELHEISYGYDPASPDGDLSSLTILNGGILFTYTGDEAEAIQAIIQQEADRRVVEVLDRLIGDEIKCCEIYGDDDKLCVGIKLMADRVREKYDELPKRIIRRKR